jgi:formylglycine-generating enzyme required for sulfatase activity
LSRLFISHSSNDTIAAKAFKQWLGGNGWPDDDVFLDVDNIGAGERWKEALRKANNRCEAVILLASPDSLSSPECLAEVRKAEDYGKEIVVVLLRDVKFEDRRLDAYKDRQIVNLALTPQSHTETVDYRGEKHEVSFNADALASVKDYLFKRGITPEHFAWPPADTLDASPFPGLTAFTEEDAGIFFGRDTDILRGLDKLRLLRRNGRPPILVIQAASGAGKSSYLRAGLWPRLERDFDFAPIAILRPAQGILTGPDGLGRKLAGLLSRPAQAVNPGDIHAELIAEDTSRAVSAFNALMAKAAAQALEQRRVGDKQARTPALVIAVDQAEELFSSDDSAESQRFLLLLTSFLREPLQNIEAFALFTIRVDGAARLFQAMTDQNLEVPETLPLLPLAQTSYRDIILKPLDVLAQRGQRLTIESPLVDRLVTDATGADALPLLAFTLSHLYQEFSVGGTITLAQYEAMGGVTGSIEMALKRALAKPGDAPAIPLTKTDQLALLRATFIPWLARVDPATGLTMRRVTRLDDFPQECQPMVTRLVEARLLVADRRGGADIVDVAHESLLRQWPELIEWLKADADDLKAAQAVEAAAAEWVRHGRQPDWLDHRGGRLTTAERVAERADLRALLGAAGLDYLKSCRALERQRQMRFAAVAAGFAIILLAGAAAWRFQHSLKDYAYWWTHVRGQVLTTAHEHDLTRGETFQECTGCPTMVVVPPGSFMMGSPDKEGDKSGREYPQHSVTIASVFAVGKFELTFAEWKACADYGDCNTEVSTNGWGADQQPVINVSWDDAQRYVAWLARITGQPYRLLTESEYEYAARAGEPRAYPWGDGIGSNNANCGECGSQWDGKQTAPVGKFRANRFGLQDMVGNVFEWVEDCAHDNYKNNLPADQAPTALDDCRSRVVRGGGWESRAGMVRSASRIWYVHDEHRDDVGFRVARSLAR